MKRAPIVISSLFALSLVAGAVACGGGGGGGSKPAIQSFTASPASLPPGGGTVTLTWKVSGATALEVEPMVGLVAGTAATVNVSSQTTFTLSALNAHGVSTKQAIVTTAAGSPITVTGRVVNRGPLKNALVAVIDQGLAPVTTATDGSFTISNVIAPYTIVAWDQQQTASVFVGVTRNDPTLQLTSTQASYYQQSLSGALSGSGIPFSGSSAAIVTMTSPEGVHVATNAAGNGAWSGDYAATWTGPNATTATVHGLEYAYDGNGHPTTFGGFGTGTVVLGNGGQTAVTNANATLATVTTDTFSGTYATNLPYFTVTPLVELSNDRVSDAMALPSMIPTGGTFTFKTPVAASATIGVLLQGQDASGGLSAVTMHGYSPDATGVAIAPLDPVKLFFPPTGGTVSADTVFSYQAAPQSVVRESFSNGSLTVWVHTYGTGSFKMPDLSEVGMNLASGQTYYWTVSTFGPFNTLDDALGPLGLQGSGDLHLETTSTNRSFHYQ